MIDLGVWRQFDGVVVRCYGSERFFTFEEFGQYMNCLLQVFHGAEESVTEDYRGICEEIIEQKKNKKINLVALGLAKPKAPVEITADLEHLL